MLGGGSLVGQRMGILRGGTRSIVVGKFSEGKEL